MNPEELEVLNSNKENFESQVLQELDDYRFRLGRKYKRLRIMGFFYEARKVEEQMQFIKKTKERMEKLLGVYSWIQ